MSKNKVKRKVIKRYSEELKIMVVNAVEQEEMSVYNASQHYKVPERCIYEWKARYGKTATVRETINVTVKSEFDKIRQLEGIISELSIKCKVLREQVKIYEETIGEEGKKKLNMRQLEDLERLKKEMENLLVE